MKDGGPAFPVPSYVNDSGETHDSHIQGMSLRDWFAGKALAGYMVLYSHPGESLPPYEDLAGQMYELADAMLAAREQQATGPVPGSPGHG